MKYSYNTPRPLAPGMGEAVARRTVLRKKNFDGTAYSKENELAKTPHTWETWSDVADRVAMGNTMIRADLEDMGREFKTLRDHIANGSILMSGRHLQHGDEDQPLRPQEVFTNCSTAATSFMKFYLLLNGSGVGRSYDDDMMVVDWSKMPYIHCVLKRDHKDFNHLVHETLEQALHKYGSHGVTIFKVGDTREGWAQALEFLEKLTFEGTHSDDIVIFDFSGVRPGGSLIRGMQNRPSSGPVPTMNAFNAISTLKGCKRPLWWQNMYVDHYTAESVLVGGSRRSSRIAVKHWRDPGIIEFINIKKPLLKGDKYSIPLWSANNSVGVDEEFWAECERPGTWAARVLNEITTAAYHGGSGEPGVINLHKLERNDEGFASYCDGEYASSKHYPILHGQMLLKRVAEIMCTKRYPMIVNPCGEITLSLLGGYCVIADIVPYHCESIAEFEEAARLATRALIRTNLMDCVYHREVQRTNRIGVGMTGLHEFAYKFFGYDFYDLIDEKKSRDFWETLAQVSQAVSDEAESYSAELSVTCPHTNVTMKPSGTVSKLFGLTEGAHLPSMLEFMRWVQFRTDDPLVAKYKALGYPTLELVTYRGSTAVGFPTQPEICKLGMGDRIVTAPQAKPQEQYLWVKLLEEHWLCAGCGSSRGNQISYTLKYDPKVVSYDVYREMFLAYQKTIRCCSVMPASDDVDSGYEYLPEQPVTREQYLNYVSNIRTEAIEDIGAEHLACAGGACPVDFKEGK